MEKGIGMEIENMDMVDIQRHHITLAKAHQIIFFK